MKMKIILESFKKAFIDMKDIIAFLLILTLIGCGSIYITELVTHPINFETLAYHDCYEEDEMVDHIMNGENYCKNCGENINKSSDIILEMQGYCPSCEILGEYKDYCSKCGSFIPNKDYSIKLSDTVFINFQSFRTTSILHHATITAMGMVILVDVIVFIFFLARTADIIPEVRRKMEG
jgi:hypothetical protein